MEFNLSSMVDLEQDRFNPYKPHGQFYNYLESTMK
jgi:hypothetical protein